MGNTNAVRTGEGKINVTHEVKAYYQSDKGDGMGRVTSFSCIASCVTVRAA